VNEAVQTNIVDLTSENVDEFYPKPGEEHALRRAWVREMLPKGLRVKRAYDENGRDIGSLHYMPVEEALDCVDGESVNVLHCSWILEGMKGYHDGSDIVGKLLKAVEEESRAEGRGVALTWWKQRRKHLLEIGYEIIDEQPPNALLLKAFAPNQRVWFVERQSPQLELIEGKIVVDVYWNIWCSGCAYGLEGLENAREAVAELGEDVVLREHKLDRNTIKRLAASCNLLFVNGVDVTPTGGLRQKEWVLDRIKPVMESQT